MTEHMTAEQFRKQIPKVGGRRVTPETSVKEQGKAWLSYHGWLHYPILQQGITPANVRGLPDRIAIKDGRTVYLEFKSPKGRLSAYQELRRAEIEAAGALYLVVRDVDDLEVLEKGGY